MSQASANEQYLLELVNKSRAASGLQPLAFNGDLNESSDVQTDYLIAVDKLTHTGSGGTSAYQRMVSAGYDFNGSSTWGENIGWRSISGTSSYQDEITIIHDWLMNSSGHRANILNGSFREVGIGIDAGAYMGYNAVVATEDFATSKGSNPFLTGVAFDDKDGDRFYDIGEGLGSVTVTAKNSSTGQVFTTTTGTAGGYSLELPAGSYSYSFSASGFAARSGSVSIGSNNVKLDWVDPAASTATSSPSTADSHVITGTSSSETLTGTTGDDTMYGLAGNDSLKGGTGADTMKGGTGNDTYYVSSTGDVVIELSGEGTDTISSSINYMLGSYLEKLTLTGTSAINGTGNSLSNYLTGNDAANVLKGLDGNDKLYGNAGNDRLEGGNGDDFLQGGSGQDTLVGGAGRDTFDWNYASHSGKGAAADLVLDFQQGYDKIDLSGIDARVDTSDNQTFSFIGTSGFHGVDGELRYLFADGDTVIQGDTNGDKVADFEIRLDNHLVNLQSTDFVL